MYIPNCAMVGGVWSCTLKQATVPDANGACGYGNSGHALTMR